MKQRFYRSLTAGLLAAGLCLSLMFLPALAEGNTPVAENLEITTYRGVSVDGRLSAVDPDGDLLTFTVTTPPTKGIVELGDNGSFVYTPHEGKRGKDYFGYVAQDAAGNRSQEATVIIKIAKAKTDVTYSDMAGVGTYYDALVLAERGVFTGQQIGESYVFAPETAVTRGEFLTMCMELTGGKILSGVSTTGFADDDAIPTWQKPYVATALMNGTISGYSTAGAATFSGQTPITCAEAAVMLNSILSVTDVSATVDDPATPVWAGQSVANLTACRILPDGFVSDAALTRAQAAQMLVSALEIMK